MAHYIHAAVEQCLAGITAHDNRVSAFLRNRGERSLQQRRGTGLQHWTTKIITYTGVSIVILGLYNKVLKKPAVLVTQESIKARINTSTKSRGETFFYSSKQMFMKPLINGFSCTLWESNSLHFNTALTDLSLSHQPLSFILWLV